MIQWTVIAFSLLTRPLSKVDHAFLYELLVVATAALLKVVWLLSAISVSRLDPFELHVG